MSPDQHYVHPQLAALYDESCGWSQDREFYLQLAGPPPQKILDLGCGTGLLCRRYAALGHEVVGLDPAPAMLAVAEQKSTHLIQWVLGNAQDFQMEHHFDLIIMTGHAFQVLISSQDRQACFQRVAAQLKPTGRFVFESRNPQFDWAAHWNYHETIDLGGEPVSCERKLLAWDGAEMRFELRYLFAEQVLVSHSHLRFASLSEIQSAYTAAGLKTESIWGDWDKSPLDAYSQEMIFVLRL